MAPLLEHFCEQRVGNNSSGSSTQVDSTTRISVDASEKGSGLALFVAFEQTLTLCPAAYWPCAPGPALEGSLIVPRSRANSSPYSRPGTGGFRGMVDPHLAA